MVLRLRAIASFTASMMTMTSAIARAEEPVVVHVAGTPGATLLQEDEKVTTVCVAPCTATLDPQSVFRIAETPNMAPSAPFQIERPIRTRMKEVTLTVHGIRPSSSGTAGIALEVLGGTLLTAGAGAIMLGYFTANPILNIMGGSGPDATGMYVMGTVVGFIGLIAVIAGVALANAKRSTTTVTQNAVTVPIE